MPNQPREDVPVNGTDSHPIYHSNSSVNPPPNKKPKKRAHDNEASFPPTPALTISPVDPMWQNIDPTPDVCALFVEFDNQFFGSRLKAVEVRWSPRMTLCAGLCVYERRCGHCSIRLSEPLLKYRPRKDLVETLLHEMIHAFLFVTENSRDRDGHGPNFKFHMNRINQSAGTKITVSCFVLCTRMKKTLSSCYLLVITRCNLNCESN